MADDYLNMLILSIGFVAGFLFSLVLFASMMPEEDLKEPRDGSGKEGK